MRGRIAIARGRIGAAFAAHRDEQQDADPRDQEKRYCLQRHDTYPFFASDRAEREASMVTIKYFQKKEMFRPILC